MNPFTVLFSPFFLVLAGLAFIGATYFVNKSTFFRQTNRFKMYFYPLFYVVIIFYLLTVIFPVKHWLIWGLAYTPAVLFLALAVAETTHRLLHKRYPGYVNWENYQESQKKPNKKP